MPWAGAEALQTGLAESLHLGYCFYLMKLREDNRAVSRERRHPVCVPEANETGSRGDLRPGPRQSVCE